MMKIKYIYGYINLVNLVIKNKTLLILKLLINISFINLYISKYIDWAWDTKKYKIAKKIKLIR